MAHNLIAYLVFGLYVKYVAAIPATPVASQTHVTTAIPTTASTSTHDALSTGLSSNSKASQFTPWTKCTNEGVYQCLGKNVFQQCRYGHWSIAGSVTVEEECDFHGEIEEMFPFPPGLVIGMNVDVSIKEDVTYTESYKSSTESQVASSSNTKEIQTSSSSNTKEIQTPSSTMTKETQTSSSSNTKETQSSSSTMTKVSPTSLEVPPTETPKTKDNKRALEDRSGNSLVAEPRSPNDICLNKRQLVPTPSFVLCGPDLNRAALYLDTEINSAVSRGTAARMYSAAGFPKEFGNYEGNIFTHGCQGQLYEYPLVSHGTFGQNGAWARGKERVIFNACGQLCAIITHRGALGNSFRNCDYH